MIEWTKASFEGNGPKLLFKKKTLSITHKNKSGKKSTEDKHSSVPGVRYIVKDAESH